MRILLIGEFSNLHWTLAEEFRKQGHYVQVVSSGDGWKNYDRDIDINFKNRRELLFFLLKSYITGTFKGFDIVQLINYQFIFSGLFLKYTKNIFNYLKRYNKKIILGAFGDDYFYTKACVNDYFEYSPFDTCKNNKDSYAFSVINNNYLNKHKSLNEYIADNSDLIIACLCDYYISYKKEYNNKLIFIPLPVSDEEIVNTRIELDKKIKIFIGIQEARSSWKGTDIIEKRLTEFVANRDNYELIIAKNLPYDIYKKKFEEADVVFDQLYSQGNAMNGLLALAKGKIVFGGGSKYSYELLKEESNFPVIEITPKNINNLEELFLNLKNNSSMMNPYEFIIKHHAVSKIANDYIDQYKKLL